MDMMGSLTPNELRNQVFKTRMRGYDRREVSAVLEEAAAGWENLIAEGLRLQEKNAVLEAQVKKYSGLEQTLRDTLVVARRAAEGEADAAKKQAEVVVEQARLKAEALIREADTRAQEYRRDVAELQAMRNRVLAEIRALLRSFAEQLDRFNGAAKEGIGRPALGESSPTGREKPSAVPPSRTYVLPSRPDRQPNADDSAAEFDASLSRIFGDEAESPATMKDDPLFADEGAFDEPSATGGKPRGPQPGKPAPGADDAEKNW